MSPAAGNRVAAVIVAAGLGFCGGAYAARQAPAPLPERPAPTTWSVPAETVAP